MKSSVSRHGQSLFLPVMFLSAATLAFGRGNMARISSAEDRSEGHGWESTSLLRSAVLAVLPPSPPSPSPVVATPSPVVATPRPVHHQGSSQVHAPAPAELTGDEAKWLWEPCGAPEG